MKESQERQRVLGEARSRYLSGDGTLREVAEEFGLTYGVVARASAKGGWYGDRLMRRRILSLEKAEEEAKKAETGGGESGRGNRREAGSLEAEEKKVGNRNRRRKKAGSHASGAEAGASKTGAAESAGIVAGEVAREGSVEAAGGTSCDGSVGAVRKKCHCGGDSDSNCRENCGVCGALSHFGEEIELESGENGGAGGASPRKGRKVKKEKTEKKEKKSVISSGEAVDKLRQIVLGLEKAMAEAVEGDLFIERDGENVIFDGKLFKEAVQAAKILCDSVRDAWDIPTYSESLKKEALDKGDGFDGVFSVRFEGGGEDYAG